MIAQARPQSENDGSLYLELAEAVLGDRYDSLMLFHEHVLAVARYNREATQLSVKTLWRYWNYGYLTGSAVAVIAVVAFELIFWLRWILT